MALVGAWVVTTFAAICIAWAGVHQVAQQVVEPLPPTVGEVRGAATAVPMRSSTEPHDAARQPETGTEVRTYQLLGGTVSVEFSSSSVRVLSATPQPEFTRTVEPEGSTGVRVTFESDNHRSRLDAWWESGPQRDIHEDDRS